MISAQEFAHYSANPDAFRASLMIEVDGREVRCGDVLDQWQREDFAACDPGWKTCIGLTVDGAKMRSYLERPRGHSKTSDLAIMVCWALCFAPRILRGYAFAADKDQARLLRDAILKLARLNPFLSSVLDVQQDVVRNVADGHPGYGSQLDISASDVGSSFGILPDFIIADEVTNWPGDGSLWHSLISSAGKKNNCFMCVISNAGRDAGDSWQWLLREFARTSAGWHFRSLDGPRATWISAAALEEQRQVLPGNVYLRLVLNQWTTGGDALSGADIAACVTESNPMNGDEHGWRFCGGLDLSTKRDHSSLVILGSNNNTSRVRVALVKSWAPGPDGINLIDVRDTVIKEARRFRTEQILYDPHQAALLAMDATRERVKMVEMPFTGANCNLMASTILETFRSRRIDLYNDPQLITDISRLNIVEKSFGWKLEASRGSGGSHSDRAMAMAIALPAAIEAAGNPRRRMVVAGGCSDSSSSSDTPARRTLSGIGDRSSAGHALARRLGRNF